MRCKDAGRVRSFTTGATEDAAARRSSAPTATQPLLRRTLRVVEHEPVSRLDAGRTADRELDCHLRSMRGCHPPGPQVWHNLHHLKLAVAEHGVDREAHEEHVDRAGPR